MENKIKKACKVVSALSKLAVEVISLIGWIYFIKIALVQIFN